MDKAGIQGGGAMRASRTGRRDGIRFEGGFASATGMMGVLRDGLGMIASVR